MIIPILLLLMICTTFLRSRNSPMPVDSVVLMPDTGMATPADCRIHYIILYHIIYYILYTIQLHYSPTPGWPRPPTAAYIILYHIIYYTPFHIVVSHDSHYAGSSSLRWTLRPTWAWQSLSEICTSKWHRQYP